MGDTQLPAGQKSDPSFWGVKPIYPDNEHFWKELAKVVELQYAREDPDQNNNPNKFYRWPKIMEQVRVSNMNAFTLADIAAAVNGEYPASIQQTFIEWVLADNKARGRDNLKIIRDLGQEFRSARDFIGVQCRIAEINTWSFQ